VLSNPSSKVIDGFHRHRVGKESSVVRDRVKGYLPTVIIKKERENKNDRIASTIRHNRARGKHAVSAMSDIVIELKRRNWSEARISKELGMDEDEILRLCQISGLAEAFENDDFSKAWESAIHSNEPVDLEFEQKEDE
jgi:ParB-like chromosome segregation protein Spo0J